MKTLIITLSLVGISLLCYNKTSEIAKPVETAPTMPSVNEVNSKEKQHTGEMLYNINPLGHVRHLPYTSPYVNYLGGKSGEGC